MVLRTLQATKNDPTSGHQQELWSSEAQCDCREQSASERSCGEAAAAKPTDPTEMGRKPMHQTRHEEQKRCKRASRRGKEVQQCSCRGPSILEDCKQNFRRSWKRLQKSIVPSLRGRPKSLTKQRCRRRQKQSTGVQCKPRRDVKGDIPCACGGSCGSVSTVC